MKRILQALSIILLLTTSIIANATSNLINIGEKFSIYSEVLSEERNYWVHLPTNYDKNKKYPVVYLLDADWQFHEATGVFHHMMKNKRMPASIVVGMLNTNRPRDMIPTNSNLLPDGKPAKFLSESGGANNFLKFIKTELMPKVEQSYATHPHNTLIGHSFAGLFTLYALLEDSSLFQSYIAMDPSVWFDDEWLVKKLAKQINQQPASYTSLYISGANNPDKPGYPTKFFLRPQRNFFSLISSWQPEKLHASMEYFPEESHFSVRLISLYKGLSFIYQDYELSPERVLAEPALLDSHYALWSKKLGYKVLPPKNLLYKLAYQKLKENKYQQAINLFKRNTINYPSARAFNRLAGAYVESGQIKLAIKNYEKVLTLDTNNKRAQSLLVKLKESIQ